MQTHLFLIRLFRVLGVLFLMVSKSYRMDSGGEARNSGICSISSVVPFTNEEETETIVPKEMEKNNESSNYLFIVLFYFLGTSCFVPHNFYVTANEYWMYKFRNTSLPFNTSDIHKTTLQKNFTAYAGIAGNVGTVSFLFVTFLIAKKISIQKRIIGSMCVLMVIFAVTLFFTFFDTDSWQFGFFIIAVGTAGFLNAGTSVLLVSLFQLASRFPPRYLAAQLAGQSICGILASVVQVFALLIAPSVTGTASLYYSIAAATIGGTLLGYVTVWHKSGDFRAIATENLKKEEEKSDTDRKFDVRMLKRVLKKLALLLVSLTLGVTATQILNPGVTSLIVSSGKGTSAWSDTYFVPVCVFFLFSTMEFIGREASNHISVLKNIYVIFGTSVVRIVLVPLILLCNIQPKSHIPVAFHNDAFFIVFMILLAVTSGYVLNIVLVVLPQYYNKGEKTVTMSIIVLTMIVFVTLASVLSGVMVNLI